MPRVFLVTGSSAGIGRELVKVILDNGDKVVATARKPQELKFEKATPDNFLPAHLDLLDSASVHSAFDAGLAKFGRIDVVVNNGGIGLTGPFEDYTDEDIKRQMDINYTGVLVASRVAIKVMREQSPPGGLIQQVTSVLGRVSIPWMSMYVASKFAVEGFTEAVAQEMDPKWNIKFQCIELGSFRTDFFTRSAQYTNPEKSAYDLEKVKKFIRGQYENQNGDPEKAAKVMYQTATEPNPPAKLAIGPDAYNALVNHYKQLRDDLVATEKITCSTTFDDDKNPNLLGQSNWTGP